MAIRIYAVLPEMEQAAGRLTAEAEEFRIATEGTRNAADALTRGWEGDAREAFVTEQQEAIAWYQQMNQLMLDHSKKLREAAQTYADTDAQCAQLLRSV